MIFDRFKRSPPFKVDPDIIQKLIRYAHGDVELVHDAIWAAAGNGTTADLQLVMDFISKRQGGAPRQAAHKDSETVVAS
jgi:hypothetical protein